MKMKAWMQMGTERRETVIDIPDDVCEDAKRGGTLELCLEEYALEWMGAQYGWGWCGAGFENDFGFLEHSLPDADLPWSAKINTKVIRMGVESPLLDAPN